MTGLLKHVDNAQQSFSSENHPSLQNRLPALEALHQAWSCHASRDKYAPFSDALKAGIEKITEYYDKTNISDIYIFTMCKFKKHWDGPLYNQVIERAKKAVSRSACRMSEVIS